MRCPNCGNENPDDYTFCDECGARLQPQEDAAEQPAAAAATAGASGAVGAPSQVTYAPAGATSGGSIQPVNDPPQSVQDDLGGQAGSQAAGATAVCPNCGSPVVPGEAYCSECGAELPANVAAASAGEGAGQAADSEPGGMAPYTPDTLAGVPAAQGAHASAEPLPVTEDTSGAVSQPAEAEAVPAPMPGVTPMAAEAPSAPTETVEQPPAVSAVPTAGGGTIDHAEWANQALAQLETGQQAMARGDFVGYGQAMSELRAFLLNIAQTAGSAGAAVATGQAVSAPSQAPAYEQPAPVEPSAEAGELAAAPVAQEPVAPAVVPGFDQAVQRGAALARLVVISSGAELPLPQQEEITVGREDPSSGIFPDIDLTPYGGEDGGVSRRHARLLHMGNDYFVEDLQSTNYTKVDGQRLPARVREKLEDGARLDFGRVAVIFRKS